MGFTVKEDAYNRILSEYSSRLIKYCYSILGNYHDAEDAAQESLIKLYYKMSSIDNENAVISYMYRIAYSVSIDITRAKKKHSELNDRYGRYLKEKGDTYEINDGSERLLSEELYRAMMTLKPEDRALVHGIAVEELSYSELAIIIGKSEASLRKRYERAKKRLVRELGKDDN